jgi:2-methylcitrate dehydratase PrpD
LNFALQDITLISTRFIFLSPNSACGKLGEESMTTNNNDGQEVTRALIENVMNTGFEDIEPEVVDNSKRRILDMVGDIIGGTRCPGNPELARLVKGWAGRKEATVMGFGGKGPAHDVAMANAIFGRSFDRGPLTLIIEGDGKPGTIFIDGKPLRRFANHITETTVPTALALGEHKRISGKELIAVLVAGDDLAARLHIANDHTPPGQVPSPDLPPAPMTRGTTTTFGATAIASRLLGLDQTRMSHAFGLAMMLGGGGSVMFPGQAPAASPKPATRHPVDNKQAANPGWRGVQDPFFLAQLASGGYEETVGTKMSNGIEARNGINAAQLAAAGWPGLKDPFFGARGGFYPGLSSCNRCERITANLGKKHIVEQVFKPWPGGRPTNAPTEAALNIVRKYKFNSDDIEEVTLFLSPAAAAVHYSKPYLIGDYPTMSSLWSFYFAVGSTLYRQSSRNENFMEDKIRDPKLQSLIQKVKLDNLDRTEGIELQVKLKDGRTLSEYVARALGEPYRPMPRENMIDKFKEQIEFSGLIGKTQANRLIDLLENLESVDDISCIISLAAKSSRRYISSR